MKKKWIISIALSALLLCPSLHAALSPFNQSVKEIEEILSSEELQDAFNQSEPLTSILHFENGYRISTKSEEIFVEVQYDDAPYIGPRKYRLIFHEKKVKDAKVQPTYRFSDKK